MELCKSYIVLMIAAFSASIQSTWADICKNQAFDIVFIIDTSSSIWHPDFDSQLKFIKDVAEQFDLGQGRNQTRIGVVSFGETYYLQFHLWQNNRKDLLENALLRIRHKASKSTNTAAALRFMRKYMFTHRYGSRKYSTHVAVVITDGKSQNRKATLKAAEAARNNGIEIFGFGVGDAVDFRELENIASKPTSDFVYEVKDFQSLDAMKFVLVNRACKAANNGVPGEAETHGLRPVNGTYLYRQGATAILQCTIENQVTKPVIWRRDSDPYPLSIGEFIFIADDRYSINISRANREYNLTIRNVQFTDEGVYQCTHGSDEKTKQYVTLKINGSRTGIGQHAPTGISVNGRRFVNRGDTLRLVCNLTGVTDIVRDIDWYKDGHKIHDRERKITITMERSVVNKTLNSVLEIRNSQIENSGTYVCRGSSRLVASQRVQVLNVALPTTRHQPSSTSRTGSVRTRDPKRGQPESFIQADVDPRLNVTNCGGKPADVYFALDASNSIWPEDFKKQLIFLQDLVSLFDISSENTRVGLITYSDTVRPIFGFDTKQEKRLLMDKIANVTFMGGRTKTSEAFKFLREQGFSPDVARREVAHIVLTFTDGLSKNPRDTAREAELARRKGIYLFSIGIGMSVEKTELAEIASEPEDDFVFHVANFSVLNTIKDILAIKTCAVDQPEFVADEHRYACDVQRDTDLVFVYDSSQLGMKKTKKITKFVYDVTSGFDMSSGKLKVGRLTENCLSGADVYLSSQQQSMDFDQIYFPDFRRMIRKLAAVGFSPQYGARRHAAKVAVLFLDDENENLKQAAAEVVRLHETHSLVVTIGDIDIQTAAQFSSKPLNDYLVHIPSYKYLPTARTTLVQKLCNVIANSTSNL